MNKWIFSVLIVLLAVQGLNAGLIGGLIQFVFSIVGYIFNILISIPSVIISFTSVFSVFISNVVFVTFQRINVGIFTSLSNIQSSTSSVANATVYYRTLISSVSRPAKLYGKIVVGNVEDCIENFGYSSSALASIVIGCAPPDSPPISFDDSCYPSIDSCLSTSNSTCNGTAISCQAVNFVKYSVNNINNIALCGKYLQSIVADFNCSVNGPDANATQALLDAWANVTAQANLYVNVSANGTLLTYANATFSADFEAAINLTAAYISSYTNATEGLLNCTKVSKFSIKSRERMKRFGSWQKKFNRRGRRRALIRSLIGTNSFIYNANSALAALLNSAIQFQASINSSIWSTSFIYSSALSHGNTFRSYINKLYNSFSSFLLSFNITATVVSQLKSEIVLNATTIVNDSAYALITQILNDNNTNCINMTALVAEAVANFSLNVENCGSTSDNVTETITINAADIFRVIMFNTSLYMNVSNSCYQTGCAGNLIYTFTGSGLGCANDPSMSVACPVWNNPFKKCPSSKATNINNCLATAVANLTIAISVTDSVLNSTLSTQNNENSNATLAYSTCVNAEVNATLNALATIALDYGNCKNSTDSSTTTTTTTTLTP